MHKLLITGASGFLGYNLCRAARERWEVTGTVFSRRPAIDGVKILPVDLRDPGATAGMLAQVAPDAVIHCAAASDPNFCQLNPEPTHTINVEATAALARLCAGRSIPFVFTSSDLVFDGTRPPYRETDPVCPVSTYGLQKAEAERRVLEEYPEAAVCRMALMFGDPGPAAKSFVQPLFAALREGRPLRLFTDEYRSILGGRGAAAGLLLALEKARGILHLGGPRRMSRYEFGLILGGMLGTSELVRPALRSEVPMPAPRPPDVTLDSSKARQIGFSPPPVEKELQELLKKRR
jgi:dTDP-4-dehydrorhamnose reductase